MSRNAISVAEEQIREELNLSLDAMGWVLSAFFWSYALAQVPSGLMGHHLGSRKSLSLMAVAWSLGTAASGLAVGLWSLLAARTVFGAAQAGIFPCSAKIVSNWLPNSRRALATGLLGASMSIGGALGAALTGVLLDGMVWGSWRWPSLSWQVVFILFAIPGIAWAVGFYYWFRDNPADHPDVNEAEQQCIREGSDAKPAKSEASPPVPWLRILLSLDMLMICGQQFFRAAGYSFFATWFPTYLRETHSVTTSEAGILTSLPLLATVIGATCGGVLVDWIWNRTGSRRMSRQLVGAVALGICACFILAAYPVTDPVQAVLLISAGSLFAAVAGSPAYTVTIDKAGPWVAPVFGVMNMTGNLGAAACPIVVAQFVKQTGSWELVLPLFVLIYAAGTFCWLLLNPNGTFE